MKQECYLWVDGVGPFDARLIAGHKGAYVVLADEVRLPYSALETAGTLTAQTDEGDLNIRVLKREIEVAHPPMPNRYRIAMEGVEQVAVSDTADT